MYVHCRNCRRLVAIPLPERYVVPVDCSEEGRTIIVECPECQAQLLVFHESVPAHQTEILPSGVRVAEIVERLGG